MPPPAPYPTTANPNVVPADAGPVTRDEWVAIHATAWSINWANDVQGFSNPFFSNDAFAARGLTAFDTTDRGVGQGAVIPMTYGAAAQAASYAFDNWDTLSPQERAAFLNPIAPNGKPLPDIKYVDPGLAIDSYNAQTDRIQGEAYANNQNAQAQAALMGAANDAMDISLRHAAQMAQVDADREATASRERIATADRGENARQFDADLGFRREGLAENRRQFDLSIAEDRRQFNATMIFNVLKTGAELAKQPVDWVAHQFYMANMGIPLGFLETQATAMLLGAIPPTGPSSAGPVIGGPAALDGDTELADQLGVQAQLVPLSQAVAQNPGTPVPGSEQFSTTATAQNIVATVGSLEAADVALGDARAAELPTAVGDNPVVAAATKVFTPDGRLAQNQLPQPVSPGPVADTGAAPVMSPPAAALPQLEPGIPGGASNEPTAGIFGGPVAAVSNADTGIYTGGQVEAQQMQQTQALQAPAPNAAVQNPQGQLLIQTLAAELGVTPEQLNQLIPPSMLAAGYSKETLMQMPVIQALMTGADRTGTAFRTAPVAEGQRFATIEALGIPTGIRSGQDINAGLLLKSNPVDQQMLRGAIEGSGQDWNTAVNQSLRASPVGPYDVGMFGRRRFG